MAVVGGVWALHRGTRTHVKTHGLLAGCVTDPATGALSSSRLGRGGAGGAGERGEGRRRRCRGSEEGMQADSGLVETGNDRVSRSAPSSQWRLDLPSASQSLRLGIWEVCPV